MRFYADNAKPASRCDCSGNPPLSFDEAEKLARAGTDQFHLPTTNKLANLAVSATYRSLGRDYARIGERMVECCGILEYTQHRERDSDDPIWRLVVVSYCRCRLCFLCERAKSRRRFVDTAAILTVWFAMRPADKAILFTATVKSVTDARLAASITHVMRGFQRMARSAGYRRAVTGWVRTIEITRNADTGLWHVHLHVLCIVKPEYFSVRAKLYLTQEAWRSLWKRSARLDYDPVVDVRAIRNLGGGVFDDVGRRSLFEVTKYCVKPSSVVQTDASGSVFVEARILKSLHDATRGRRLFAVSTLVRAIARKLGQRDADDAKASLTIFDVMPKGAVYIGRSAYRWDHAARCYRDVPRPPVFRNKPQEGQMGA